MTAIAAISCAPRSPDIGSIDDQIAGLHLPRPIASGEAVTASGQIVQTSEDALFICIELPSLSGGETNVTETCELRGVRLAGLAPSKVPWSDIDGERQVKDVTVRGTWTGNAIEVTSLTPGVVGYQDVPDPANPCPQVHGLAAGQDTPEIEAAAAGVFATVGKDPVSYGGAWYAGGQGLSVLVVAVAGDPVPASQMLRRAYPYPACFVRVARSASDLAQVASDISTTNPQWVPQIEPHVNRVRLYVPIFDATASGTLRPQADSLVVSSLVRGAVAEPGG